MQIHAPCVSPLHLTGNTTEDQIQRLLSILTGAARQGVATSADRLDRSAAQTVLDADARVSAEVAEAVVEIIQRHTASDKYREEEAGSDRGYPPTYKVRPIEAQVTELRKHFPALDSCNEKLARKPLLEGAEAWFALPRWQALAPTYNEALAMVLGVLASKRKFANRIHERMGPTYLRQSERTRLAEHILTEQQQGQDIFVVAAQFGMFHRGCSARRARITLAGHEFALGAFHVACLLLTHPERLSWDNTLMLDCAGDEYSLRADYTFDRVPLFEYDLSGMEFSIFYDDRSRNLWGTPTGFLYRFD